MKKIFGLPKSFQLSQNYPNPFSARGGSASGGNPSTTIQFQVVSSKFISLRIYNLIGQEVATLVDEKLAAGKYEATWNAAGAASGTYFFLSSFDK